MSALIYLSGAATVCCIAWLVLAATRLGRQADELSWRSVLPCVVASSVSTATFLMARFAAAEAPVSAYVVVRGWLGFFVVFTGVYWAAAALMRAGSQRARAAFGSSRHQPSAR